MAVLNELRLPTVKRLWAVLAEQSNKGGWLAERFLVSVVEHELTERDTRRLERRRLESLLLPGKLLSNFNFTAVPTVSKIDSMINPIDYAVLRIFDGLSTNPYTAGTPTVVMATALSRL